MRKKYLVILLMVIVLGLVGCGKKEKPNEPSTPTPTSEEYTYNFRADSYFYELTVKQDGECTLLWKEHQMEMNMPDGTSFSTISGRKSLWANVYRYRDICEIDEQGNFSCTFVTGEGTMEYDSSLEDKAQEMIAGFQALVGTEITQEVCDAYVSCISGEFVSLASLGETDEYGVRISGTLKDGEIRLSAYEEFHVENGEKNFYKTTKFFYGQEEITVFEEEVREDGSIEECIYDYDWTSLSSKYTQRKNVPDTYSLNFFETGEDGIRYTISESYRNGELRRRSRLWTTEDGEFNEVVEFGE